MAKKLTPSAVAKLTYKKDGSRIQRTWDLQVPGLAVEVFPSNRKSWVLRYRINKKQRIVSLGRVPVMSLADARRTATDMLREVDKGIDPKAKDKQEKAQTVQMVYEHYTTQAFYKAFSKDRRSNFQSSINCHLLPSHADTPIKQLTREHIRSIVTHLLETHREGACRGFMGAIKPLMRWAADEGGYLELDPVVGMKARYTTLGKRRPDITDELLRSMWNVEAVEPIQLLVRWALLTGFRRDECRLLTWDQIDDGLVTLDETKNRLAHKLPITPLMQSVLDRARPWDTIYIFSLGKKKEFSRSALTTRIRNASNGAWTLHICRHAVETTLADREVSEERRDMILNHIRPGVGAGYNHSHQLKQKRRALETLHSHYEKLFGNL